MRVRDIPIPDGATDVSYMKRRGDIRFQVTSDFNTAGDFYAKKLAEQKWTKSGRDNLQRDFWVQKFAKDKLSLEVRVDSRGEGSEVRLTPKGLMWDEDDQPTPKDLPLPKDATQLKYDDFFESIEFKSPSNVKTIAEFLTKELGERKWTKAATEYDLATFVRMNCRPSTIGVRTLFRSCAMPLARFPMLSIRCDRKNCASSSCRY